MTPYPYVATLTTYARQEARRWARTNPSLDPEDCVGDVLVALLGAPELDPRVMRRRLRTLAQRWAARELHPATLHGRGAERVSTPQVAHVDTHSVDDTPTPERACILAERARAIQAALGQACRGLRHAEEARRRLLDPEECGTASERGVYRDTAILRQRLRCALAEYAP